MSPATRKAGAKRDRRRKNPTAEEIGRQLLERAQRMEAEARVMRDAGKMLTAGRK